MNNKKLQRILNETNLKLISPQTALPEKQVTGDENYITITANKSDNEGNYVLTTMDWIEIKFDYFKMLKDRNIPLDSVKSCFINFMPLYKIAINSIDIYTLENEFIYSYNMNYGYAFDVNKIYSLCGSANFKIVSKNIPLSGEMQKLQFMDISIQTNTYDKANLKQWRLLKNVDVFVGLNNKDVYVNMELFNTNTVPMNLSCVYRIVNSEKQCGLRLNLDGLLTAETNGEAGYEHKFEEKYYVLKDGVKKFIPKNFVAADIDGALYYQADRVYKSIICDEYSLIPEINGIQNSEFIEQRQEKQIQLEEYINSCEITIKNYVRANAESGQIVSRLNGLTVADYNDFFADIDENSSEVILTESEALQIQALNFNKRLVEHQNLQNNLQSQECDLQNQQTTLNIWQNNTNLDNYSAIAAMYSQFGFSNDGKTKNREEIENEHAQKSGALISGASFPNFGQYIDYSKITAWQKELINKRKNLVNSYPNQLPEISGQIEFIIRQARKNLKQIKKAFKNYFAKKAQFDYLLRNTPKNYLKDGSGLIKGFNAEGRIVCLINSYGEYFAVERDTEGYIKSIYNQKGKILSFDKEQSYITKITDISGKTVKFDFKNSLLEKIHFPDGKTVSFRTFSLQTGDIDISDGVYNVKITANFNMLRIKFEHIISSKEVVAQKILTYGENSTSIINEDGSGEIYTFLPTKRIQSKTEITPAQQQIRTEYNYLYSADGSLKLVQTQSDNVSDNLTVITYNYDAFENISSKEEVAFVSDLIMSKTLTSYFYDCENRPVETKVTKYFNQGETFVEKSKITLYRYDVNGNLDIIESYTEGEELTEGKTVEKRIYDKYGNHIKSVTWNTLDSSDKFYSEHVVNEEGIVLAEKDETGEICAEYEYNGAADSISCINFADGAKLAFGTDSSGMQITSVSQSDADGEANVNDIVYENGLPVKFKSGATTVEYEYDHKDRIKSVKVNGSIQSETQYGEFSKKDESLCFGSRTDTLYTGGETVVIKTVKEGTLAENETVYGATEKTSVNDVQICEKQFNPKGELIKIISDGEERIFTYGAYGNLLQAQIFKDGEETQTENYTYNGLGELIRKSVASDAVNQTYSYTYSENYSRDLAVSGFGDFVFKPLKDACGRNIGKEIFNGENKIAGENIIYRKVGDHGTHMPLAVKFTDGTDIRYLYDRRGNISQITENGEVSARFVYDELNRLSKEENKVFGMTCKYVYDNNGNILYKLTETKDGQEKDVYEYVGDKLVSYNGETCVYDNLGNPVEYRNKTLVWEYGKRLVNYGGVTFTYNAFGKRTSKNGINLVYDNEGNLIAQSDGLQFIYDRTGVVGVIYGGETYLCRKDIQGNITALIDNKGEAVVKYKYDGWGNHAKQSSPGYEELAVKNPFRYRGYYYDEETGLYYLQTRYYDPETGRFISQDGVQYANPEQINGFNLYAYCANNPVMNIDPNGTAISIFLISLLIGVGLGMITGGTLSGIAAYQEGRQGLEMFASIAGGAIMGGAMSAVMVIGGAAGFVAATKLAVAQFGLTIGGALTASLGIGAAANTISYLLVNGIHSDKQISFKNMLYSALSGFLQASVTFAVGFIGGNNGLFNKFGNFRTIDAFYVNMVANVGKIRPIAALFYATSMLFGDTITRLLYLSSLAGGARMLIRYLFDLIPD